MIGPTGSPLRWNGWGYKDTAFVVTEEGDLMLAGDRYELSGVPLPSFRPWVEAKLGLDMDLKSPARDMDVALSRVPPPDRNASRLLSSLSSLSLGGVGVGKGSGSGSSSGKGKGSGRGKGKGSGSSGKGKGGGGGGGGLDIPQGSLGKDGNRIPVSSWASSSASSSSVSSSSSSLGFEVSQDPVVRIHHSHGHTCREIYCLRTGEIPRVADGVVWPLTEESVGALVGAAAEADVVLVPYGGGTSVTNALTLPTLEEEPRGIVVVSMAKLNAVVWVDTDNMMACVQAGAVGAVLGPQLAEHGVTMGHEPDSYEFSTLGGWIATRASGMQKNVYGNMEDILVSAQLVTPKGVVAKAPLVPRISAGPDVHEMVLGSEGTLGIITRAVVRVRPLPSIRKYGAIVFPNFESGVAAMYDIAQAHAAPASIRLVDNNQFQMGQALKPASSVWESLVSAAKKFYVLNIKGFDAENMVAATLLFLGDSESEVAAQESKLYALAAKHGGMAADEENGRRGYALTFMIAYIRDLAFEYSFLAESFETSVPWSGVLNLCTSVKAAIVEAAADLGIPRVPFVTCRVTQTYDTGACVYFYFAFLAHGVDSAMDVFDTIEHLARDAILAAGGSISHHHGIGKHRASFMPSIQSSAANLILDAVKSGLDPGNVFGVGNLNLSRL